MGNAVDEEWGNLDAVRFPASQWATQLMGHFSSFHISLSLV